MAKTKELYTEINYLIENNYLRKTEEQIAEIVGCPVSMVYEIIEQRVAEHIEFFKDFNFNL